MKMYASMIIQLYYILILELINNDSVITKVCKEFSPLGTQQYREIKSPGIHNKFTNQTSRYASYKNIGS